MATPEAKRLPLSAYKPEELYKDGVLEPLVTESEMKKIGPRIIEELARRGKLSGDLAVQLLADSAEVASDIRREQAPTLPISLFIRRNMTRRRLLAGGVLAVLAVGAAALESNRETSEQKNKRLWEESHALGIRASSLSSGGWRVRHATNDINVSYEETGDPKDVYVVRNNGYVNDTYRIAPRDEDKSTPCCTRVTVSNYVNMRGEQIPLLTIGLVPYTDGREKNIDVFPPGLSYEQWLLNSAPDRFVDNRIVVFEHLSGLKKYVSIQRTRASEPSFEVKILNRIEKY